MSYEAVIRVHKQPNLIIKCFEPEEKMLKDRSQYTIKKHKNFVEFETKARDAVALKTVLNSIVKMLEVIEKLEKV